MKKYFINTKNMSLDEKVSWVIDKVPYILSDIENNVNIDISEVNYIVDNDGNRAAKKAIESAINLLNALYKIARV